jgi:ABC-type bacteriocin/lantibiotic exporter with double-glycine peptidase domain
VQFQRNGSYCGPASVQNVAAALGRRHSQQAVAALAGTTDAEGTSEEGVLRALVALGYHPDEFTADSEAAAFGWLWNSLTLGRPVILCTERWLHWVAAVGVCGQRVVISDPANYPYNLKRNGVFTLPRGKLLKRWYAARRVRRPDPPYYGIAVAR